MIDPEAVLENIVVNPNDTYPSYFGAPAIEHHAIATSNRVQIPGKVKHTE